MSPFALALRSLKCQPARAVLGVTGVAVVGALLFDMLLLSRGLVLSFEDLLESMGFDVRVTATPSMPGMGPPVPGAAAIRDELAALPEVEQIVPVRHGSAIVVREPSARAAKIDLIGTGTAARGLWVLHEGSSLDAARRDGPPPILVNRELAERLSVEPGSSFELRGSCTHADRALPARPFRVAGIVDFRFDASGQALAAVTLDEFNVACGTVSADEVDFFLVASRPVAGTEAAVAAIQRVRPDLNVFSNRELVTRVEGTDFSYFRQISFALSTVTLFFAFLLITTLLTVSVNQRYAEIAALRALGFTRRRVVADLLWESALLVGVGGVVALPTGWLLARWLDAILRAMPGLPERLHFFVFEPRAALLYAALLTVTGALAALYPVLLAARLPIAATLRRETVG